MTELTHLLGCELTPVEKSLIGYGESRGMRAEQERIIKLLEPEVTRHYELGLDASAAYLEQTIALIKGEQK